MSFTRRIEPFTCIHCATNVKGDGYTNHCPKCLWSQHVDIDPGDRKATCRGMMEPIATEWTRDGYTVHHRCQNCGAVKRNRSSSSDDSKLLISLGKNPLPNNRQ
ncbi:hypothetical protein COV04_00735 [Candidatus Uhrbacteria bacterium CG10_big_fil_rev_8_21_14_0_10_48_11]|uniref:RNHCP domain-containing protein n=1 Tax=Candidatus Uhrbacteria bacterium CG10_big_fil_rev_8_21_14_0_10_48_11 TaxID=1975037 RepID=A0A2M8LFH3_9BACT|nr:MAG: hypothetical protein COV04_00735 [Candidatus Uhrbacteria bacterium CG10_big_fil_rev_8_21_14_0_10_48_11]